LFWLFHPGYKSFITDLKIISTPVRTHCTLNCYICKIWHTIST
jgi:hypothetical protein